MTFTQQARVIALLVSMSVLACDGLLSAQTQAPQFTSMQWAHARQMLRAAAGAIKEVCYDPAYRGIDIQKHFKDAESRIEAATSQTAAWAVIAQALVVFDDSHTFFMPPENPVGGRIVVLVDSESASAAEVLARVLQIEKRATVIGDRTAGAVMVGGMLSLSLQLPSANGELRLIPYGLSVTTADMIMADGKSLEHTGVTPDELVLPSQGDLATGRDPALARAITVLGGTMDPVTAGRIFPIEWK